MAECGIKKYDALPGRVRDIDVDYLRWRLYSCNNPSIFQRIPIVKGFFPSVNVKEDVIGHLEDAYKEYKQRCKCRHSHWGRFGIRHTWCQEDDCDCKKFQRIRS